MDLQVKNLSFSFFPFINSLSPFSPLLSPSLFPPFPALNDVSAWAKKKLEADGFSKVRYEDCEIPAWKHNPDGDLLKMTAPYYKKLGFFFSFFLPFFLSFFLFSFLKKNCFKTNFSFSTFYSLSFLFQSPPPWALNWCYKLKRRSYCFDIFR